MKKSASSAPMNCPECGNKLLLEQLVPVHPEDPMNWTCLHCKTPVRISPAYQWGADIVALQVALLLGWLTFSAHSSGTWLLGAIMLGALVRPFVHKIVAIFFSPWLSRGKPQLYPFTLWLLFSILMFFAILPYAVALGWTHLLTSAPTAEMQESMDMFSVPLAWFSAKHFLITPQRKLFDVIGILLGNSLFYSIPVLSSYLVVRRAFKRGATIRLNLTDKEH